MSAKWPFMCSNKIQIHRLCWICFNTILIEFSCILHMDYTCSQFRFCSRMAGPDVQQCQRTLQRLKNRKFTLYIIFLSGCHKCFRLYVISLIKLIHAHYQRLAVTFIDNFLFGHTQWIKTIHRGGKWGWHAAEMIYLIWTFNWWQEFLFFFLSNSKLIWQHVLTKAHSEAQRVIKK